MIQLQEEIAKHTCLRCFSAQQRSSYYSQRIPAGNSVLLQQTPMAAQLNHHLGSVTVVILSPLTRMACLWTDTQITGAFTHGQYHWYGQ